MQAGRPRPGALRGSPHTSASTSPPPCSRGRGRCWVPQAGPHARTRRGTALAVLGRRGPAARRGRQRPRATAARLPPVAPHGGRLLLRCIVSWTFTGCAVRSAACGGPSRAMFAGFRGCAGRGRPGAPRRSPATPFDPAPGAHRCVHPAWARDMLLALLQLTGPGRAGQLQLRVTARGDRRDRLHGAPNVTFPFRLVSIP